MHAEAFCAQDYIKLASDSFGTCVALLREALTSLIREKAYDSIVVKEILDRANVGRSTYTDFRDKDELLASSIHEMIRSARSTQVANSAKPYERIIRFSLPIFD